MLLVLGALAIALPHVATLAAEMLTAWILMVWGGIGLWISWHIRAMPEGRLAVAAFGLILGSGILLSLFPVVGIAALTVLMMLSFLIEGLFSIGVALRSSSGVSTWGWLVFSGLCSLAGGLAILFLWPRTESWTLGLLVGLNVMSTGLALVMLSGPSRT